MTPADVETVEHDPPGETDASMNPATSVEPEFRAGPPAEDAGRDERDRQCNLLIDAVNAHTPKITAATEVFEEISSDPTVLETYEDAVQAAIDDIDQLGISDATVAAFSERFLGILSSAKDIGHDMLDAASDASLLPSVVGKAEQISESEAALVSDINAYCQH